MFYTYVLYSPGKDRYYIGSSSDLRERVKSHISGYNQSTKHIDDWELVYYESYLTRKLAYRRELRLKKRSKAWIELKKRIFEDRM